jgi:hypothetical protein
VAVEKKYKLRLTFKVYKLSYNYINYTISLVGSVERGCIVWRCSPTGPVESLTASSNSSLVEVKAVAVKLTMLYGFFF